MEDVSTNLVNCMIDKILKFMKGYNYIIVLLRNSITIMNITDNMTAVTYNPMS